MIQKLTSLALIFILALLQHACCSSEDIRKIQTIRLTNVGSAIEFPDSNDPEGKTGRFNNIEVRINFDFDVLSERTASVGSGFISSAYALTCGELFIEHEIVNPIDSIQITCTKLYSDVTGKDMTRSFIVDQTTETLLRPEFIMTPSFACYLLRKPDKIGHYEFTFRFFDNEGHEFVTTTDSLFISLK